MSKTKRNCDHCGKTYFADNRNLKRGWGLTCSKSCAAKKREMSKPGYDPARVQYNNARRLYWNNGTFNSQTKYTFLDLDRLGLDDYDPGDSEYWDGKDL